MATARIGISGLRYVAEYVGQWSTQTPDSVVFAVQGPRFITHMRELHDADELCVCGYTDDPSTSGPTARGWVDSRRDAGVHLDHDVKVRAPFDAQALAAHLGVAPAEAGR